VFPNLAFEVRVARDQAARARRLVNEVQREKPADTL
jgi:hypothetical protein